MRLPSEHFLVRYLEHSFRWINTHGSIFERFLSRRSKRVGEINRQSTAALTDSWVLLNFLLAWGAIFFARPLIECQFFPSWLRSALWLLFLIYPALRIIEVIVFQIWTQILGGYRNKPIRMVYKVVSLRRSVVLSGLLYIEAVVWYGVIYQVLWEHFTKDVVRHWYGALYYSTVTMTTTGFGEITPTSPATYLLNTSQIFVGWAMIVLIVSRVVAYLPRPLTHDPIESVEQAVGPGPSASPDQSGDKKSGAVATVTIVAQLESDSGPSIMLQRRLNCKENSEFRGLWELPKGKIYSGEHISTAAAREMKDETGLEIVNWLIPSSFDEFIQIGSFSTKVASFKPYYCSQAQGTHSHLALAMLVEVNGTPQKTEEADGHSWFKMQNIVQLLHDNQVFPLDVPILTKWIHDAQYESITDKENGK